MHWLVLFLLALSPARASEPVCGFYLKKSEELGCQADNYLTVFGHYYCQTFVDVHDQFTPEGAATFSYIRNCLISSLKDAPGITCENVRDMAEQHHISCYRDSNYCQLGTYDKWVVFKNVWWEMRDSRFRQVVSRINANCN